MNSKISWRMMAAQRAFMGQKFHNSNALGSFLCLIISLWFRKKNKRCIFLKLLLVFTLTCSILQYFPGNLSLVRQGFYCKTHSEIAYTNSHHFKYKFKICFPYEKQGNMPFLLSNKLYVCIWRVILIASFVLCSLCQLWWLISIILCL